MSLNREHLNGIEGLNVINDPKGNKALNVIKSFILLPVKITNLLLVVV